MLSKMAGIATRFLIIPFDVKVPESEISGAFQNITREFIDLLKVIINNVSLFYKSQKQGSCSVRNQDGILLEESIIPVEMVGIYIPAGTAPLVSSVYMTVLPAQVAGVKRIIIATPPNKDGHVDPYILAVANLFSGSFSFNRLASLLKNF